VQGNFGQPNVEKSGALDRKGAARGNLGTLHLEKAEAIGQT